MRKGMLRRLTWRAGSLIVLETCLIGAAVALAAYVRLGSEALEFIEYEWFKWLLIPLVAQICLYYADLYDLQVISDRRELFGRAVNALGATSLLLAVIYYWFPDLIIGRGVFMLSAIFVITLVFGWRVVFEWANRHVAPRERLLLVGTSEGAIKLAKELYDRRNLGVDIVGFIDPDPNRVGMPILNPGVVGTIEDIPTVARALGVDRHRGAAGDRRDRRHRVQELQLRAGLHRRHRGRAALPDTAQGG